MNRHLILAVLTVGLFLAVIELVDSTTEPAVVASGPVPGPSDPLNLPDEAPGAGIPVKPDRQMPPYPAADDPPDAIFTDMRMELDQVAEAYARASRFPPFPAPLQCRRCGPFHARDTGASQPALSPRGWPSASSGQCPA
ncbi:hypothetical protein AAIA72_12150 [Hahella sp. SMD15-11]|uniref:Uncharacterized protein n=1 Tax=Thermohahella caldifontis TaxID=3142973 RepID=A0AB39UU58_9GAMM